MGKNKDKKSKKDKKKNKKGNKGTAEGQRSFSGSLALTKMKHVILKMKGKKGKKIKMIAFPIKDNYFVKGKKDKKALYMPVRVITKSVEDEFGQHGFIAQSTDSKVWKDASEEEQEVMRGLPILGSIKDFGFSGGGGNDNSGSMSDNEIDENDDLPF